MIRFNENALLIEIPCRKGELAHSLLAELQSGLFSFLSIIDYNNAPPEQVQWALHNLQRLLVEMIHVVNSE